MAIDTDCTGIQKRLRKTGFYMNDYSADDDPDCPRRLAHHFLLSLQMKPFGALSNNPNYLERKKVQKPLKILMHFIYDLQRDILKDYRFGINVILRKKLCHS